MTITYAHTITQGKLKPLGATLNHVGCNFAVHAPWATKVELCLFNNEDSETERLVLPSRTGSIWYGFVPGIQAGQRYGYRVHGTFAPGRGMMFNPSKLLIDPYAHALSEPCAFGSLQFGYDRKHPHSIKKCTKDSAKQIPKSVVVDHEFDWQGITKPGHSWNDTILYETHVRGITKQFTQIPEEIRGTYLGMAHPATVAYLKLLGITAVQLMPIYAFVSEERLNNLGLSNYWGYNPVNFFSPDPRYAYKDAVTEVKTLVRELHKAGIEVVLDVVYNHTAEGNTSGPTYSFRGMNRGFYRTQPHDRTQYVDYSGCGNTPNIYRTSVLRMVMDSMRHWITHYHIDGFRFDLAAALGREQWDYNKSSSFFKTIAQDPILTDIKLIAEPWDIGMGGYQLGQFPEQWYECNDKFRDTVRSFWRGDQGKLPDFATRMMGSRDIFRKGARETSTSLNFITYHDGFTLEDLVSYNFRHNHDNMENNNDGHGNNISANYGIEGPTTNPQIRHLRARQKRNMIATLMLSQGSVHFLGGDEISRTQHGNNNAYCQDNEISWYDWKLNIEELRMLEFVRQMINIRKASTLLGDLVLNPEQSEHEPVTSDEVHWFRPDGEAMSIADWHNPTMNSITVLLSTSIVSFSKDVLKECQECFLLLINAGRTKQTFTIPASPAGGWKMVFNTAENDGLRPPAWCLINDQIDLCDHSLTLLSHPNWVAGTTYEPLDLIHEG
ncbi:glycogen debranching protein GlgX [Gynuella sunshinyii]|uniref:Type II secretory pathway, pullulanase PulA and related glycosidase n=1 Tax=Gynuella sunshinyii YC6258 TaxID=1445510 RepID=A0A0C5VQM5_9GAMM|nr:glycogen debranching protein GlgX [Gynuella sunshinyii]AJQ96897.1 type II secretory pathway, pullulanase PulA and related glycosidase [Gynuella sunshinyii YC6258]